jgi:predicted kinase
MNPILLIVGSPASGKSTLAEAIAKRSKKSVHIPVDNLRTMVQSSIIHPGPEWSQELIQQLVLARQTAVSMGLLYRESGFLVVIDDFWDPYSHLQEYTPIIRNPNAIKIILKPTVDVILARNHSRKDPSTFRDQMDNAIRMINTEIEKHSSSLKSLGWHIIDTTNDTLEESVARILLLIENS